MSSCATSQYARSEHRQNIIQAQNKNSRVDTHESATDLRSQTQQLRAIQRMAQNSPQTQQLQAKTAFMGRPVAQRAEDEEALQAKLKTTQCVADEELTQKKSDTDSSHTNHTGLPLQLKAGIESISGMNMDHVKVHYNSAQPAQLNAHAYAQGSDIHVAPGQEQHLPHEAWHVVQQAQGKVKPTMQMKAGVPINDEVSLEHEADMMGAQAMHVGLSHANTSQHIVSAISAPAQLTSKTALQRKRYDPNGATYQNDSENVWLDKNLAKIGHVFTQDAGTQGTRVELIEKFADAGEAVGSAVAGSAWITAASDYGKPEIDNKIDPFRLRVSGVHSVNKNLALDYHFGPYNLGYVVKVNDNGNVSSMATRDQLAGNKKGIAASYSNQHHDTGSKDLENTANAIAVGRKQSDNEASLDANTKMAGEAARFNCVKNQLLNLRDDTYFFTHTEERDVQWVKFADLWLTWSATFNKDFGISDEEVKTAVASDSLKKLTGKIARGSGEPNSITTLVDYNLDESRQANETDRHKFVKTTVTDNLDKINATRKVQVTKALTDCDAVVYLPTVSKTGKTHTITMWQDGAAQVKKALPENTTLNEV